MSVWKLIRNSLLHYRGINFAVLAGVALTSAILSGALVVGDSVKESLRRNAASRTSGVGPVLVGGERFFTGALADRVGEKMGSKIVVAPILQVEGTVTGRGGGQRVNRVQIIGVEDRFWKLSGNRKRPALLKGENWMAVNDALASRVGGEVGDTLVVKVEIPGALSKDAPMSGESEQATPFTGEISLVVGAADFGLYSLRAEQVPPATVFLPLSQLQEILKQSGRVNVLLCQEDVATEIFHKAVQSQWNLDDIGLSISDLKNGKGKQLLSTRVFLDESIEKTVAEISSQTAPVLTYLANSIRKGKKSTPYSMVTGAGLAMNGIVPASLTDEQIVLSKWLADDLNAVVGDKITLEYNVVGSGRKLVEKSSSFTVAAIAPIGENGWDRSWTPEFPGIFEVEGLDKWEPGIPVDKERIRDKDEEFWDKYKATPKAFVTIAAARKMWSNRFGQTTSIRFQGASNMEKITADFRSEMTLESIGISYRNLAEEAESAVAQSMDFGQLFAYMSFFIIVSALVLTGLVFVFGIEQRSPQIGLLLALGFTRKQARRLFINEAMILALIGSVIGLLGGYVYTRLALAGMSGAWKDAAAGIEFVYFLRPVSLAVAMGITLFFALFVVWLASRRVMQFQPSELITGSDDSLSAAVTDRPLWKNGSFLLAVISFLGGLTLLFFPTAPGSMAEQGMFFGGGFLFVLAGVFVCSFLINNLGKPSNQLHSLAALGRQHTLRNKGRSLSVIGLMAAGVFMVTAINSFRLEGERGAKRRSSGTGGFAYVGRSTLPIYEDLNDPAGRKKYGLDSIKNGAEIEMLAFRVSDGEDASCLNLNRAQRPRLVAVDEVVMAKINPFHFAKTLEDDRDLSGWEILKWSDKKIVPGIIDMNTATYALHKGLGDLIEYEGGDGKTFSVKIVGFLDTSILQGSIIISENAFIDKFPAAGGYQYFLLDGKNDEGNKAFAEHLTRMFGDRGLEMRSAARQLNEFNAVQNTYLSIFSTLGGLGVLLGTLGLAIVVGRNVMERRGQLGVMQAMGFTRKSLADMVLSEHWFLHLAGVALGLIAAVVAVIPKLSAGLSGLPFGLLIGINAAVLIGGLVFCWIATRVLIRGDLMDGLRRE